MLVLLIFRAFRNREKQGKNREFRHYPFPLSPLSAGMDCWVEVVIRHCWRPFSLEQNNTHYQTIYIDGNSYQNPGGAGGYTCIAKYPNLPADSMSRYFSPLASSNPRSIVWSLPRVDMPLSGWLNRETHSMSNASRFLPIRYMCSKITSMQLHCESRNGAIAMVDLLRTLIFGKASLEFLQMYLNASIFLGSRAKSLQY